VLLTGATGFVGRKLWTALDDAGHRVRCVTRNAGSAMRRWPEREWVEADIANAGDLAKAMAGCSTAYYLVHSMGSSGNDYLRREIDDAKLFAREAEKAGIKRIIYLGGVKPQGKVSKHLRSRLLVGKALGSTAVPVLELRAAMIIGAGSQSWTIVRDLAARLPVMVLPAWLESESEPVAIDDVVAALVAGLDVPLEGNASYDLPGPERLTGRETLVRAARTLGYGPPVTLEVPFLSLDLSTYWLKLISRADWSIARELVLGLRSDILARDDSYWKLIDHAPLLTFEEAAKRAADEEGKVELEGVGGLLELARGG
jgi:uncharacterized protein YbjT (DUF2867 family)